MNLVARSLVGCYLCVVAVVTLAQPVYRCEREGKIGYSHEPCPGAREVDTRPTQGLDKSSGVSRKGADVRAAEFDKAVEEGLRPFLGQTPEQWQARHRRAKLSANARSECQALDPRIRSAATEDELFLTRKRYRELGC
jgi:hypothetical protein